MVFFHQAPKPPTEFLRGLMSAGYPAVTFFFVLSGFVLAYVYSPAQADARPTAAPLAFWRARAARILPAYYLGLAMLAPRFLYTGLVSKIMPVGDLLLGLVLVPTLLQAWWPRAALLWNTPAWSLSVEALFYAVFPLLLLAVRRIRPLTLLALSFALVVAVAILLPSLIPDAPEGTPLHNFRWFFPLFHLPQFIFGVALARVFLFSRQAPRRAAGWFLALGVLGLVGVFGFPDVAPAWMRSNAVLTVLFGLMLLGAAQSGGAPRWMTRGPLLILGEASYATYLFHVPIAFWWDTVVHKALGLSMPPWIDFALYFAVVVAASIASFFWVERPLRRWILGQAPRAPMPLATVRSDP